MFVVIDRFFCDIVNQRECRLGTCGQPGCNRRSILRRFLTAPLVVLPAGSTFAFVAEVVKIEAASAVERGPIAQQRDPRDRSFSLVFSSRLRFHNVTAPPIAFQSDSVSARRIGRTPSASRESAFTSESLRETTVFEHGKNDAAPRTSTFGRPVHRPAPRCSAGLQLIAALRLVSARSREVATSPAARIGVRQRFAPRSLGVAWFRAPASAFPQSRNVVEQSCGG